MDQSSESEVQNLVALAGLILAFVGITLRWILSPERQVTPDPWPLEVDRAVRRADAIPLCVECLCPQGDRPWFCPHCGFPGGENVVLMEYLQIFPIGEVLRRGVLGPPDRNPLRLVGYALLSVMQYMVFFPIYWFWLVRKACGHPIGHPNRPPLQFEDNPPL